MSFIEHSGVHAQCVSPSNVGIDTRFPNPFANSAMSV